MTSIATQLFSNVTPSGPAAGAAPRRAPQEIVSIKGVSVDISGQGARTVSDQQVTLGKGVSARVYAPPAPLTSDETTAEMVRLQQVNGLDRDAFEAARNATIAGTPYAGMTMAGQVEVTHQDVGAVQSAPGLGFIPGNVFLGGDIEAYFGEQIDQAGALSEVEQTLRDQYGQDVKLAQDTTSGDYVMLRPGQAGYDDVRSASDVFAGMPLDLRNMDIAPSRYAEAFARHGLTV